MDLELNNKFDDLDRAMQIAAKCRFKASRRQRRHKQIAQGTIALLSLELIIVPTLVLGGLKTGFSPGMTAAVQICAAVFVLVFSLLIGTVFGYRLINLGETKQRCCAGSRPPGLRLPLALKTW